MKNKKVVKIIIIVAIVAVVIALVIFGFFWIKNAPKRLVKNFISEMEGGDINKIEKMFDFKGWYAWDECDYDADSFKETYDDATDEDVEERLQEYFASSDDVDTLKERYLKDTMYGDDNVEYTVSKNPTIKKLGKNLYSVKTQIKIDDDGYDFKETWCFIIYKNKIIYATDED